VIIASTARDLAVATEQSRREGQRIALVPTMGALHRGHTSLFDIAKEGNTLVVASIFVNPRQFGDPSDFNAYPITLEADLDLCRQHGVDVIYSPTASTMYPSGFATTVHIDGLTDIYEGQSRPGHFDGVTTVVTKLFNACRPDCAVFGQKDFQQVAVIRRLILDLDLPDCRANRSR
jgi:pantoate--beta-alanine ligase